MAIGKNDGLWNNIHPIITYIPRILKDFKSKLYYKHFIYSFLINIVLFLIGINFLHFKDFLYDLNAFIIYPTIGWFMSYIYNFIREGYKEKFKKIESDICDVFSGSYGGLFCGLMFAILS